MKDRWWVIDTFLLCSYFIILTMFVRKAIESGQMTPKESLFVAEYLVSLNAAGAYRKAGYSSEGANVEARKTLKKPHIAAEIARRLEERHKRLEIDADALLRRAIIILTADPRELCGLHIGACRFCHGRGHDFQWRTEREWTAACEEAVDARKPQPSCNGGFGYNIKNRPHQDCPECSGLGVPHAWFADTRDLSPEAQILFEGVKQTRAGMEIMQASKAKAFDLLARHHGLMTNRRDHTCTCAKPIGAVAKARVIIAPIKDCTDGTSPALPPT
jgi:phage terminase small subunit